MLVTAEKIADWAQGRLAAEPKLEATGFSTDSRTLNEGEAFVAIRGLNFDGHDFIQDAFEAGASLAIVSDEGALRGKPGVVVHDTVKALGDMAHRHRWSPPLIPWLAVTGSNGKTTTRAMISLILTRRGTVASSPRNYNNYIGLPLSILSRPDDAWVGVLELGTSSRGEIARLTEISTPTVGIITSVSNAHLEELGTLEAVAEEKACIFDRLPHDGLAIYPVDDPYVEILRKHISVRGASFGIGKNADMVAENVHTGLEGVSFTVRGVKIKLPLLGLHNVRNCLAALLAVEHMGISLSDAAESLRKVQPVSGRLELIHTPYHTILNDVYNANPASLKAAVDVMDSFGGRRVIIIGDMLELGGKSKILHRDAGLYMAKKGIEVILAVGKMSLTLAEAAANANSRSIVRHFRNVQAILRKDEHYVQPGDVILVKGSRGMQMEKIISTLLTWEPR
jgi:UDP-N-acetylmuramoyl-tripeptide--D-alanyl-D-alanine ligase